MRNLAKPDSAQKLVDAALARFDKIDAAVAFSGQIISGRFMDASVEDLRTLMTGCIEAPFRFLQAVTVPMVAAKSGQIVVITSATGARPTPGAPLSSAVRAGATMLARNVAAEIARTGVQVNVLGTLEEFASFSMAFLDGQSRFTTGQFVGYAGGWA